MPNKGWFRKGHQTNNGRKWTEEHKEKMSGKNHYAWTGDKASYSALHMWLHLHLGSAKKCETCGLKQRKNGKKSYFHWANISHTYKRDLKDWKQLCVKCHTSTN